MQTKTEKAAMKKQTEKAVTKAFSHLDGVETEIVRIFGGLEAVRALLAEKGEAIDACLKLGSSVSLWNHSAAQNSCKLVFFRPLDAARLTRVLGGRWERALGDHGWYDYEGVTPQGLQVKIFYAEIVPQPQRLGSLGDEIPSHAEAALIEGVIA